MDAGRGNLKNAQWQREQTGALPAGKMEHISQPLALRTMTDHLNRFKVARNEVEKASFAQRSAYRDSRIWRLELIEPAAERK